MIGFAFKSLVMLSKSEAHLPGQSLLSSPGLQCSPTASPSSLLPVSMPGVEECYRLGMIAAMAAFSLLAMILGECLTIHSPPAPFLKVEISLRILIPLFIPGSVHSGSTS